MVRETCIVTPLARSAPDGSNCLKTSRHYAELLQEEGRNTGPDKKSVEILKQFLKLQDSQKWVKSKKRMGLRLSRMQKVEKSGIRTH